MSQHEGIETTPEFETLDEQHPVKKALLGEREENRNLKAKVAFLEVKSKFPQLNLDPSDFEGRTPDRYESYAQSLAERFGQRPGDTAPTTEPVVEPEPPKPEVETFARMARTTPEGKTPTPEGKITRKELEALRTAGKISLDDARELIRQDKVIFSNVETPKAPW